MLIASAGHVDHGKTTLVRLLTGVDTDRLPEEKSRGVSIDLGFAYTDLGTKTSIGFVDVPGHERFIRNMLAGVGGIDVAMLVIAADDGPMPQTHEHLAILNLLGIECGVVVISRTDLVDAAQLADVTAQCRTLITSSNFSDAKIFPVSSITGDGVDALRQHLANLSAVFETRAVAGRFRMAIDRQFTVAGSGLVVTGTVYSGELVQGESVMLYPGNASVRVRELRVQDQPATRAHAGDRCALNLNATDLGRLSIQRGHWLVGPPVAKPTQRFDVLLNVLSTETRAFKHWSPVHVHFAASSATGRVALLEQPSLSPGEQGLAQVIIDDPWIICAQDRVIIRDQSAQRTIAGASVIDPYGPARGRARTGRLALLRAIRTAPAEQAVAQMLTNSLEGIDPEIIAHQWNLTNTELNEQLANADTVAVDLVAGSERHKSRLVSRDVWQMLNDQLANTVSAHHAQAPEDIGILQRSLIGQVSAATGRSGSLVLAAIASQINSATLRRNGQFLHRPKHQPTLSSALTASWARIEPHLSGHTLRPPVVTELAKTLGMDKSALQTQLLEAAERGLLTKFAPNRFFHPQALIRLSQIVETLATASSDGDNDFDARAFRDASGIGRNLSIEVLEYFDAHGLTRRIKDRRIVIGRSVQIFGQLSDTQH